jgi:hypothetical protein
MAALRVAVLNKRTDLTDTDIELLSQYIDGELEAPEARRLEERLSAEPALQIALVHFEELNQRLRDALTEHATIPEAVTKLLENPVQTNPGGAGKVLPFPQGQGPRREARSFGWPAALAASLVAAVALGLLVSTQDAGQPGLPGNDARVAGALDRQPSGGGWTALGDGRELQAVLTFPHQDGRWCREYLLRGGDADWRAVACRDDNTWVTQAAGLESFLDAESAYRPAGAGDAAAVAVFINQNAADIALGRSDEQALLARWSEGEGR